MTWDERLLSGCFTQEMTRAKPHTKGAKDTKERTETVSSTPSLASFVLQRGPVDLPLYPANLPCAGCSVAQKSAVNASSVIPRVRCGSLLWRRCKAFRSSIEDRGHARSICARRNHGPGARDRYDIGHTYYRRLNLSNKTMRRRAGNEIFRQREDALPADSPSGTCRDRKTLRPPLRFSLNARLSPMRSYRAARSAVANAA